eukprot:CAMPEP_0174850638 /NCGR_PEP_ID=MMETSP1114-20130205/20536_1 /TAXON_ID=312471 /ORGANISM="Neobodo designis, Strain CCAP 1951/1" /LENGTH=346 /DNA_ID=CAMNT_0016085109 /DNA_START=32 /DNA_END=1072 /DNA_ORIENTATION=+
MSGLIPEDWRPNNWTSHAFVTPSNAGKANKPVVNVAQPGSAINEEYYFTRFGVQPHFFAPRSLNHFLLAPEIIPYIDSHSTWECCFYNWCTMNVFWGNLYIGRKSAGQVNPLNPRTAWAHKVVLITSLARLQVAWLIGICGGFYLYEFLYTHVPGFKINDPSPEGWKAGWREGQSTFLARWAACCMCYPAWYAWRGTWKRGGWLLASHLFMQTYYEFGRISLAKSSDRAMYQGATMEARKQALYGQLTPDVSRTNDPDSNKPEWWFSYENLRFLHSSLAKQAEIYKSHEYQPLNFYSANIPNPYFDFQKAAQMDRPAPLRYHTDLFELPNVMSAPMRGGALDAMKS